MAEVQAIKDNDTIRLIGHLLSIRYHPQMADVWHIGLNLALRISDLLSIRFSDITDDRLLIRERKTGKLANIQINNKALERINKIRKKHPNHIYLFQSYRCQQVKQKAAQPLSRRAVSMAFQQVGKELNIALGTHSMRKTRGYFLYQATKDIGRVMKMLRHSSEGATLRYIGITQDDVDNDFMSLEI
ncbi:tyrosine-type recombinase/integrase [Photobacterium halotolerans]|uniref:tyrosine-type recombinase/integrase n=1 Tax=Photobacterium halotolerans TaxID=265726 RepID=UPI001372B0FA|nr:tyrosine-type recombinase/integrase [Photobacterium halotolerans]NAX49054.1 tyrosine-type recombinase/integrase [Photobacterium halotolerans]